MVGLEKWQSEIETCLLNLHRNRKCHEDVAARVLRKEKGRRYLAANWT